MHEDGSLRPLDPVRECHTSQSERLWIEARLVAERAAAARAHKPPLAFNEAIAKVRAAWERERLAPAVAAARAAAAGGDTAAMAEQARVDEANAAVLAAARVAFEAAVAGGHSRGHCLAAGRWECCCRSWRLVEQRCSCSTLILRMCPFLTCICSCKPASHIS